MTDNTTITIPSTATVGGGGEGQRQEGSTSKKQLHPTIIITIRFPYYLLGMKMMQKRKY